MKKYFWMMIRRIKQKVLFEQIFEFLESEFFPDGSCIFARNKEWLFELTCHTKAVHVFYIKNEEIENFYRHVLSTTTPYTLEDAAKCVRKFYRFCRKKKWIQFYPWDLQNDYKELNIEDMKNLIRRPTRTPDLQMVQLVKKLYNEGNQDGKSTSYQNIADYLNKKFRKNNPKKFHRQNIYRYYHWQGI